MVNEPSGNGSEPPIRASAGLINRVLGGRYELLEAIGEGPLLAAFRARDRSLNRIVAVKVVRPHYTAQAEVRQHLRDGLGQVLALNHPNIVRAFDLGEESAAESEVGSNLLFLAEEYVRGIDLKERIRRAAPFQLAVANDTALALAEALEYAHERGVVHGDVRPQNVLIGPEGLVKLTGFGVADAQSAALAEDSVAQLRIIPYIAPDSARAAAPTASGDLYALGVVLFELLTGEMPYKGATVLQIALSHAQEPIPSPREINNGVPRALDGIVRKALGKRPTERYASATELLSDLRLVRDALRYGRSLSWSPLDPTIARDAVPPASARPSAATRPSSAPDDATVPAITPFPTAERATPAAEETLVMPVTPASPIAVTAFPPPTPARRAMTPPASAPLPATSPYANSAVASPSRPVAATLTNEEESYPVAQDRGESRDRGGIGWLLPLNLFLVLLVLGGIGWLFYSTFYLMNPPSEVIVPNLVGRTLTDAKQMAVEQHFDIAVVDEQFRDTEKSGVIYQMNPAPGRHIRAGKNISVYVSKGPRMVDVPDVRSMSFEKARRVIEKNFLKVGDYTFEYDVIEAKGNVLRQAPAAGESRARGTGVDLVLSKGEEPPPTPAPDLPPTEVTPPPTSFDSPNGGGSTPPPTPDSASSDDGDTRVRTFNLQCPVPKDNVAHRIRIDVTDRDGSRTVLDESRKAGETVKQRITAVGKNIRIRIFDNDELREEQVK